MFADVIVMPQQSVTTAFIGTSYAGDGWGFYMPPEVGDVVLVTVPNGDTGNGLVVTQRVYSGSDRPPPQATTNPTDVTMVVRPGKTVRILVSGGGDAVLAASDGSGSVRLGAEGATRGVARIEDSVQVTIPAGLVLIQNPAPPFNPIPNPVPLQLTGTVTSGSDMVRSS